PFDIEIASGSYWLTRLKSKQATPAMQAFREWLLAATK
ncbi:MAG: ampR, partial [Collimonas fungivorans]|nr:ampR [Collimonas fungivorans]